jgi:hypothetical protein
MTRAKMFFQQYISTHLTTYAQINRKNKTADCIQCFPVTYSKPTAESNTLIPRFLQNRPKIKLHHSSPSIDSSIKIIQLEPYRMMLELNEKQHQPPQSYCKEKKITFFRGGQQIREFSLFVRGLGT